MLTAALLLSTAAPAFALSVNEVAALDAEGVAIEVVMPQAAPMGKTVAIVETDGFTFRSGMGYVIRDVVKGQHIDILDETNDLDLITSDSTLTIDDLDIEIPQGVAVNIFYLAPGAKDGEQVWMWSNVPARMALVKPIETPAPTTTATPETTPETTPAPTQQPTGTTEAPKFADVQPGAWYYESVTAMAEGGLLQGFDDGLFHPEATLTVGQFAMILARITGLNTTPKEGAHWASGAMASVAGKAIYIRNDERAEEAVNRGEALTSMVTLATEITKYATTDKTQAAGPDYFREVSMDFKINNQSAWLKQMTDKVWDFCDIPDGDVVKGKGPEGHGWNSGYVVLAYNLGIVQGIDEAGTCAPEALLTRAQICELLYRMGISKAGDVTIHGFYGFG